MVSEKTAGSLWVGLKSIKISKSQKNTFYNKYVLDKNNQNKILEH